MNHYINASGWWVATFRRDWREDVTDGPNTPVGTVLGNVTHGDWEPVAMWKIEGDDHTTAVPLIVEDGSKVVQMGTHISSHRELFYVVEYSPNGKPPRKPARNIVKE